MPGNYFEAQDSFLSFSFLASNPGAVGGVRCSCALPPMQFAPYALVYVGTFFDPPTHVPSSFHRLAGAPGPVAILAVVGAVSDLDARAAPS